MNTTADDFQVRAAAATARVLSASNPTETLGKSLTDSDAPKIVEAAKSFASLVAARSICTTDADASAAAAATAASSSTPSSTAEPNRCTFHKTSDPTHASLMCARSLLIAINSTEIPESTTSSSSIGGVEQQLENDVIRVVWNGCVKKAQEDKASSIKPSKALGRRSLLLAYPHVMKRMKSGPAGSDDASLLPARVDKEEALAFFEEFGKLLNPKSDNGKNAEEIDDHFLIWSTDGGAEELKRRRERRAKRGKEAAAVAEVQAKTELASGITSADAIDPSSSTVSIEELSDDAVGYTSGDF